ncbi:hypothetical protein [Butyrivibrio sp. MC2021]|uniref:hypothetical protein n=1 Tax=Butyrivibrio sp. MC2021 TaxID=1408306 RepID=UPI00047AC005|nr:hypothetical protein [Butyrivibrio sp. MC2021]
MWDKKLGKVFTSAVCVGLTATMLAGCGKAKEDSFVAEEYEDDFFDKLLFYPTEQDDKPVYVNLKDETVAKYDLADFKTIFEDKGSEYEPVTLLLEKGGILYLLCSKKDAESSARERDAVFAVDKRSKEIKMIVDRDHWDTLVAFDYYDGAFYAIYDTSEQYIVYKILKEKGELNYHGETDSSMYPFFHELYNYECILPGEEYELACYERILGEYGFIVGKKDDGFYRINADGEAALLKGFPDEDDIEIIDYDSKYVIFSSRFDYPKCSFYLDIDKEKYDYLPPIEGSVGYSRFFLEYQNEKVYYKYFNGSYVIDLHSYDIKSGDDKMLVSKSEVIGSLLGYYSGGVPLDSLIIRNGKLIFRDRVDGVVDWCIADMDDADNTQHSLGIDPMDFGLARYGHVESVTAKAVCPRCNAVIDELVSEYYVFEGWYSETVDQANETLMAHTNERVAEIEKLNAQYAAAGYTEDDCKKHTHKSEIYRIYSVKLIDDTYLAVSENCTRMAEGEETSHDAYHLYNLQTGEEHNIMDFYPGTVEELQKLLSDKAGDAALTPDISGIAFEEKGIKYSKKDNSGYNFLSYEELLGRQTLADFPQEDDDYSHFSGGFSAGMEAGTLSVNEEGKVVVKRGHEEPMEDVPVDEMVLYDEPERICELADDVYISLFYPVNDVYGARVPKQNFIKLMKNYSVNCYYRFDENGKLIEILGIYYS